MAQAEVKTFNFTYSGASFGNFASAKGFITLDTDLIFQSSTGSYQPGSPQGEISTSQIVDLGLKVTSATMGNGDFNKSDFDKVWFSSPSALDFSRELVGQTLSNGGVFGTGEFNGFILWASNNFAPTATFWNQITTANGTGGDRMNLVSMTSVSAVPEADTSAMLLMGAGLVGFIARRRKSAQA